MGIDKPLSDGKLQARAIRPVTKDLVGAVLLDVWPSHTAIVDFGLDSQEHLEALYYPLRHGDITPEQVDAGLGNGPKLTALARSSPSNPHKDIEFRTRWDDLVPEPVQTGAGREHLPTPGEIALDDRPAEPVAGPRRDNGRGR